MYLYTELYQKYLGKLQVLVPHTNTKKETSYQYI
jgi:hypothetical protein